MDSTIHVPLSISGKWEEFFGTLYMNEKKEKGDDFKGLMTPNIIIILTDTHINTHTEMYANHKIPQNIYIEQPMYVTVKNNWKW